MRAVENDENWYLMCPDECPGLTECYGEDFDKLYNEYSTHIEIKAPTHPKIIPSII